MREIFFLMVLLWGFEGLGQTYTIEVRLNDDLCIDRGTAFVGQGILDEYRFNSPGETLLGPTQDTYHIISKFTKVPVFNNYSFSIEFYCDPIQTIDFTPFTYNMHTYSCDKDFFLNSISNKGGVYSYDGPFVSWMDILSVIPNNLSIENHTLDENICAGELISLSANELRFHDDIYIWQFSRDNVSWQNIPFGRLGRTLVGTMHDFFGDNHVNYFGDIYFRIGLNQPFSTNTIKINYQPCAPIITDVQYEGPACHGGGVQKLAVTFDRALDATKGEDLSPLYVRETTNNTGVIKTTPMFQVGSTTYPADTKTYNYTNMNNFVSLESGREYEVVYQARINHPTLPTEKILKGTMVSAKKFRYIDPAPLTFSAIPTNPKCQDQNGSIALTVSGGTPPYGYNIDNETELVNGETKLKKTVFVGNSTSVVLPVSGDKKIYNIKVTDANDCFEKP